LCSYQALIEKDWLAFGHPFSDRVGLPTLSGSGDMPLELPRQSSVGSFHSSPIRQQSGSFASSSGSSNAHNSNNYSPIFLQVRHLLGVLKSLGAGSLIAFLQLSCA